MMIYHFYSFLSSLFVIFIVAFLYPLQFSLIFPLFFALSAPSFYSQTTKLVVEQRSHSDDSWPICICEGNQQTPSCQGISKIH